MPLPNVYTRRRQDSPPHPQSSASSTSSATSIRQTGRNPSMGPPSSSTSHVLLPTTTTWPRRARHLAPLPPAVPFYPDIRRRLRYRNNAIALSITEQKSHLIQRLLLYCRRLSSDLCSILCTCENTLEPDNPWLSASWIPLADTDTKSAVHYVPSPNHSHTWVMTPVGLREAAEVLEGLMKYDMPDPIHQQMTEVAHTLAQIHQGLQAEMRLYSGRYGAGRELHTKWEIHWNKDEREEKEWKEAKYQEILKDRENVQAGRRHVMQTTGMTEEEIVRRARTPFRKRRRNSSSTVVPTMEAVEKSHMRTYYQRPGFTSRSGVAADWLSEIPIAKESGIAPELTEASQRTEATTSLGSLLTGEGWVSAENPAWTAAIQFTLQQEASRMTFREWARFAHSLRWAPMIRNGSALPVTPRNHSQSQMNVEAHPTSPSQGVQIFSEQTQFSRQAVTAMAEHLLQAMELENSTVLRQTQQSAGVGPHQAWGFVPSRGATDLAALERSVSGFPFDEGLPISSVGPAATTALNAPSTAIPAELDQRRARAASLANRVTTRQERSGQFSLARNRDVNLPNWALPGSQARTDDAAIRERYAAERSGHRGRSTSSSQVANSETADRFEDQDGRRRATTLTGTAGMMSRSRLSMGAGRDAALHNSQITDPGAFSTASGSNATIMYEVQDGRAAVAATITAVDNMRRARIAANTLQTMTEANGVAVRERNAALQNSQGADSTTSSVATASTILSNSQEQNRTASTAVRAMNIMWQPWLAPHHQSSLARPDDAAVRERDTELLGRYRAVLAEEEQEFRSGGRSLLERRADRRREDGQRAPPRALDVTGTDFVGQQDRTRLDGTVPTPPHRAERGMSVFSFNTSLQTSEEAFWWQGPR